MTDDAPDHPWPPGAKSSCYRHEFLPWRDQYVGPYWATTFDGTNIIDTTREP